MAEKKSKRLAIVEELAKLKEDVAAKQLGEILATVEKSKQQLELLNEYRNENQDQIRQIGRGHASGSQLQRHQLFLQQVEAAILSQQERLILLERQVEKAKKNWQQLHYRHQAIGGYVDQIKKEETAAEEKAEQKEMDDRVIIKK